MQLLAINSASLAETPKGSEHTDTAGAWSRPQQWISATRPLGFVFEFAYCGFVMHGGVFCKTQRDILLQGADWDGTDGKQQAQVKKWTSYTM